MSRRYEENRCLVEKIKQIWHEIRGVYGSPRVTVELRAQGFVYGENQIARLMRENGIKARTKKKFKVTTKSDHNLPIAQDLVERDFSAYQMNELWLSDITYFWIWEGWMYLVPSWMFITARSSARPSMTALTKPLWSMR